MIINKNIPQHPTQYIDPPLEKWDVIEPEKEIFEVNPLVEIFKITADILKSIKKNPNAIDSEPLFRSVRLNTGQLSRIYRQKQNTEGALDFPAAFVHFVNMRWLVQTTRIGEGRAEMRVCFVLNRLNPDDEEFQTEGFDVFQLVHRAIEGNMSRYNNVVDRIQLNYFDQVENFDSGLQQFWITYDVQFKDYSTYRYKDYIERTLVIPPFTNHSDQAGNNPQSKYPDETSPSYEDASKFAQ